MIVPTLATIVVGTAGLLDHVTAADNADRARVLAVLAGDAGELVNNLQAERAAAIKVLDAGANVATFTGEYKKTQQESEQARGVYAQSRSTLADVPESLRTLLDRIEQELGDLPVTRNQVTDRTKIARSVAYRNYQVLIGDLLEIRNVSAQLTGDTTLTDRLRAASAMASAKEFVAQEQVIIDESLADNEFSDAMRRAYTATRNAQDLALTTFRSVATSAQAQFFSSKLAGPEFRDSLKFESSIDSLVGVDPTSVVTGVEFWDSAMEGRIALMNDVEVALNSEAQQTAVDLGDRVQRQVLLETGLLLLTLLLGVLFAWLVARSMARSLRDLRQGALAVAQYGLPQAVARLRDPSLSSAASPHTVALQIAEPLPVRSRDEFGQVTEAFNAVHLEAVRTAAEQASLRASVATMFVNLARRSQILVDRLIGHLDRLERGEQDPDRLSELFQLDHLATRMRRNDENLLVLAGADSTRVQREPAALMDVLRAAQSEVEYYTRIDFGAIDPDIEIAAHAVNDMVHLVAELFDNATSFSPPDTPITVEAWRVAEHAVLSVEDRGIGMSPDQYSEYNEKLASPPTVDVAVSRMMGLVVVARLAARHGVRTQLRPARERGTVAEVTLPAGVLVPRALAGRSQMPIGFPAAVRPAGVPNIPGLPGAVSAVAPVHPAAPQRPVFPAPLALESAPSPTSAWGAPPAAPPAWTPPAPPSWAQASGPPASGVPYGASPSAASAAEDLWSQRPPTGPSSGGAGSSFGAAGAFSAGAAGAFGAGAAGAFGAGAAGAAAADGVAGGLAAAAGGLGAALAGSGGSSGWPGNGSRGSGRGRNVPAWGDLTGASPDEPTPSPEEPLPQRRQAWGEPSAAEAAPPTFPSPRTDPYSSAPAPSAFAGPPPAGHRPAWPPAGAETADGVPAVPHSLSASLDLTSELPRMPAGRPSYADDLTMELPIFQELESAWFSPPAPSSADDGWRGGSAPADTGTAGGADWATEAGSARDAGSTYSEVSWPSAADDGWGAAQAAMNPHDGGTTDRGLPRRVPMAQLVPGGVDANAPGRTERRTPDGVRGLLSAYTRGVQRGRGAYGADADSEITGKEQEA
jgi:signal transduction histidine kinase